MRRQIVAGNWKMNKKWNEGISLIHDINNNFFPRDESHNVIICPPDIFIREAAHITENTRQLSVGSQNCSEHNFGAYTGEISPEMLKSAGAEYVIIGHSERREYHGENNETIMKKIDLAISSGLHPIFCCGEAQEARESNEHFIFVKSQLEESLFHLTITDLSRVIIAYEPIWAIGTGLTATPEQAQEMHAFIRKEILENYNEDLANSTTILYGGSCKPANAEELFSNPDVDGGLIGGASLQAEDFISIVGHLT